jgi:4'-phosphopantetheinyl transferase
MLKTCLEAPASTTQQNGKLNMGDSSGSFLPASFKPAPELTDGQIHIWTISKRPLTSSDYIAFLSKEEFTRASGMRSPQLFDRFVADHGALRLLLSAYLDMDPRKLPIAANSYGKPALNLPLCRLSFNMSHSGELTLIALCLDSAIGVDVEIIRPIAEWEEIASSHFSQHERESLQAEEPAERLNAFFRCWTRKEALIKAIGMGLSIPLDSFTVNTSLKEPPALLHCAWAPEAEAIQRWTLIHLEPAAGHVGALAIEDADWSVQQFQWS